MITCKRIAALALVCMLALGATALEGHADGRQGAAPDFQLPGSDGVTRKLSDYRGRWVVLEWVNFDCIPVTRLYEAPGRKMQTLQRSFMDKGVVWLMVNSTGAGQSGHTDATQAKAALTQHAARPTALLLDPTGAVGRTYGATVTPEVRVISPGGNVVYAGGVGSADVAPPARFLAQALTEGMSGRALPFASKPARGCKIPYGAASAVSSGPQAPDFVLTDSRGIARRLSDYRGKWVILEWVNYDCPFVKKHYDATRRNMQTLQSRSAQHGIVWLSICSSARGKQGHFSAAQVNARMQQLGATPTAYLLDPSGTVGRSYGARTSPEMRVITPQGAIAYSGGIDSVPSMRASDIPQAKNYIALALADIVARRPIAIKKSRTYGCSVKY